MQNVINLVLDLKNKNYNYIVIQQNDDVVIEAELYDNGIPVDLSNYTVIANFTAANDTFINIAGSKITKNNNKTTIVCEKYFSQSVGNATGQITLVDATSKQASTFPFKIKVNKGIINNPTACNNAATILEEISKANVTATTAVNNIKDAESKYPDTSTLYKTVQEHTTKLAEPISSSKLDTSSDGSKIKKINLSTEVLDLINNPTKQICAFSDGGIIYGADINGEVKVWEGNEKTNIVNKDKIYLGNGKDIVIRTSFDANILVYCYDKDKTALGLASNSGTDYYEGMTIPTKANTSFINITIRKKDLTDIQQTDTAVIYQGGAQAYQTLGNKSVTADKLADMTITDNQTKNVWGYVVGKDRITVDFTNNVVKFSPPFNLVRDNLSVQTWSTAIEDLSFSPSTLNFCYLSRNSGEIYVRAFDNTDFINDAKVFLFSIYNGDIYGLDTTAIKVTGSNSKTYTVESHWKGKKANFLGDSITIGSWGGASGNNWTNIERPYPKVLGELLGLDTVRNYGIGGTHLSSAFNSTDSPSEKAMASRYVEMDDDADLIVVAGGTNDYGHTDTAPFGTIADTTDISFYGALNVLCKGLIQKYLGKTIVFMTPLHTTNDTNVNPTTNKKLVDYVDAIKEVCALYGIKVIDNFRELGFCPSIYEWMCAYQEDGLHPNPNGHTLMAKRLYPIFNSIG